MQTGVVCCCLVAAVATLAAAADGDWPALRRDPQNTALSPLTGRMSQAPVRRAALRLGGSPAGIEARTGALMSFGCLVDDLDGDGVDEVITAAGGPVRAFGANGRERWRRLLPTGKPFVLGAADFDGCGVKEVVVSSGPPAGLHVLSGRDGRLLWERTCAEQVYFTNGTRLADLDGDGRPELFLLGNAPAENSHRVGWCYSFRDGFKAPHLLWGDRAMPFNPHYRPQTIVADVDGDRRPEIVVASALHSGGVGLMVAVLDALTGEVKRQCAFANGDRCYGHLQAVRTGDKPQLDLLVVGLLGREHMTFFANDAAGLREVWHVNETFEIPLNPVADLDGDGRLEVVYTRHSAAGEAPTAANTVFVIRNLATGELKRERPGFRLQGVLQRDGDPRADLIGVTVPDGRIVFHAETPAEVALSIAGASLCIVPARPPLGMMNEDLEDRSGYTVFARDLDGDGVEEVFVRTPEALLGIDAHTLKPDFELRFGRGGPLQVLGSVRTGRAKPAAILCAGDGGLLLLGSSGKVLHRLDVQESVPRTPIVARLTDRAAVLVTGADASLRALDGPSLFRGREKLLWSQAHLGGFATPTVADVDGDGVPEVLACDRRTAEPVILDADGRVKRRLPPLPTDGTKLATGSMVAWRGGKDAPVCVGAVSEVGPNDGIAKFTAYDAQTGKVLWWREGGPHPRRTPCVVDLDGDGADELVWSTYFDLLAVEGRTGANRIYVGNVVPGYHLVSAGDPDANGRPSLFFSGGYMALYRFTAKGERVWATPPLNYDAGSAVALADVDGDGRPELGTAFSDHFACYDTATGEPKWAVPLPGQGSDVAAADIDGDGRPEFLTGCTDGHLYAVQAAADGQSGHVLWQVFLDAPVGPPAIADLDGDGKAEIVVATLDGRLHVLAAG
ncbi:MAG: hypothetical protein HYU66_21475 [Armatimonadetes bacterium]|nr:hypothetical protein [Armatimonadota bacterium]